MAEKTKILIIEDDPFFIRLCLKVLEDEGFAVSTAGDGELGIEKFKEVKPDLVLLDIILPKKDGIDVLREIRSNPDKDLAQKPIIILTNLFEESTQRKMEGLNIDSYLIKASTSPDELVAKVKSVLKERSSQ